jgi:hypothetical protein
MNHTYLLFPRAHAQRKALASGLVAGINAVSEREQSEGGDGDACYHRRACSHRPREAAPFAAAGFISVTEGLLQNRFSSAELSELDCVCV